jgi:hypothetical protein
MVRLLGFLSIALRIILIIQGILTGRCLSPVAARRLGRFFLRGLTASLRTSNRNSASRGMPRTFVRSALIQRVCGFRRAPEGQECAWLLMVNPGSYLTRRRLDCKQYFKQSHHQDSLHPGRPGALGEPLKRVESGPRPLAACFHEAVGWLSQLPLSCERRLLLCIDQRLAPKPCFPRR